MEQPQPDVSFLLSDNLPDRTGKIDYRRWAWRVISWDALVPAGLVLIPTGVELVFPGDRAAMEMAALVLPIAAFFLRFHAGYQQIRANRCSELARALQFGIFFLGILPLVLVDCFMILLHLMPGAPVAIEFSDIVPCAIPFFFYLAAMTIAMYPGRTPAEE